MLASLINSIKKFLNLTFYTSELDKFLSNFEDQHPKLSPIQQQEKKKYDRIHYLRDNTHSCQHKDTFWDKF